ncbi:signal transducer and activator of transcription 6 isoform X2 [Hemicordylus capensis]|uniref:signal transducer and activator of transcription 6 isoform X2 n=1 Tax=Hemicordylus capensis TaxID=884348 RepID=UPI00230275D5|nr:signal transducer and activator of transcription 6 isoform X2 [Hemicordylus capensis]
MTNSKMTQWSLVSNMPPEQSGSLIEEFPRTLRCLLGDWLENHPWEFISCSDHFCTMMADSLLTAMVKKLQDLADQNSQPGPILQLIAGVKTMYQRDSLLLVSVIKRILEGEQAVIRKKFQHLPVCIQSQREELKFAFCLQRLQYRVQEIQGLRETLKPLNDSTRASRQRNILDPQFPTQESLQSFHTLFLGTAKELEDTKKMVLMRFQIWKRQQQLAGNGTPFDEDLGHLQKRCESLVDVWFQLRLQLVASGTELNAELQSRLQERLDNVFSGLVKNSFLVDKQPIQVLKTQTKFQATVRFLLGPQLLKPPHTSFTVTADIVSEKQARELATGHSETIFSESTGEIVTNKAPLETNASNNTCCAVFKNMLLKKIKRCDRKSTESVTEEKCAILFHTNVNLGPNKTTFHLQALSLPVVVIVHGNQDNNAKATILWDNAFSEPGRIPFVVTERVSWKMMCETLNQKFMAEVQTTNGLCEEHYYFLAQKIFGDSGAAREDFENRSVTWAQFNKEILPGRGFTFWQWFEGVLDLTKRCLKDYWSDGLIMGFISKQYVYSYLINEPVGTFLLRFSDSEIGGISIAYVTRFQDGSSQVENIQPFTAKQLSIRSLADCVLDLSQLELLYPRRPKYEAFGSQEMPRKENTPYVPARMKMTVDTPCPSTSLVHTPGGSTVNLNHGIHSDSIYPDFPAYSLGNGSPLHTMESSYPMLQAPDMSMDICLANDHTTFPTQLQFPMLPNQMRVPGNISPPSEQELVQLLHCEQDLHHCSYSMGSPCS